MGPITILLVIIISLVSILGFSQPDVVLRCQFNAFQVYYRNQYYRLVSHGLVHANWEHLLVNMIVLWSFGTIVEHYFTSYFGNNGDYFYIALFIGALIFSSIWSLIKQKNNVYYNAIGASGAVSAVLFAAIFFDPWEPVYFFAILPIPGVIFGILYLYYSYYMSKKQIDNIGHEAHFLGAVLGFITPILIRPSLFNDFMSMVLHPK